MIKEDYDYKLAEEYLEDSFAFKFIESLIDSFGCDYASYWGNALAGEAGEALEVFLNLLMKIGKTCNFIKKFERDNEFDGKKFAEELADIFIYTVLTARWFGIDLEEAILEKIKVVKARRDKK